MINLRIGQFHLAFDGIQWTVSKVVISKGEKSAGQDRHTDFGYHSRLAHALQDVMDRLSGSGEAENVQALHAAVDAHARAIFAAVADVERQLIALRHGGDREPPF